MTLTLSFQTTSSHMHNFCAEGFRIWWVGGFYSLKNSSWSSLNAIYSHSLVLEHALLYDEMKILTISTCSDSAALFNYGNLSKQQNWINKNSVLFRPGVSIRYSGWRDGWCSLSILYPNPDFVGLNRPPLLAAVMWVSSTLILARMKAPCCLWLRNSHSVVFFVESALTSVGGFSGGYRAHLTSSDVENNSHTL